MSKRLVAVTLCAAGLCCGQDAWAQQQTVNVTLGYFAPVGVEKRSVDDVLFTNLDFLAFDVGDFSGPSIGGEWLVGLGEFLEAGVGASWSRQRIPSVYADFVDTDGSEVAQDLSLSLVPVVFSARVLPFGQSAPIQPYVGAGVAIHRWQYAERGEFIDFGARRTIFRDEYVADGRTTGAVVLGGLRVAGDRATGGVELRRQFGTAQLDDRFSGRELDLGGWTVNLTLGVRF